MTQKKYVHDIAKYALKRVCIASAGFATLLFVLLSYILVRGSNIEGGQIIIYNYLLILALIAISYLAFAFLTRYESISLRSLHFTDITSYISSRKSQLQYTIDNNRSQNVRESYGFHTNPLSELTQ